MKKISAMLAVVAAVILAGCNQVSKEEYQQATNTNDSLMYVALQQGNEIYELSTTLNAVSDELDQINGQIALSNGENQDLLSKRERLLQQIAMVKQTIEEKQKALDELQKKYSAQLSQNKVLKQTIDRLQSEVAGYETKVAELNEAVANKEQQIVGLTETLTEAQETLATTVAQNEQQQEVINTQDEMLNTGFYIVGDKKKLKDLGLLEGSLLSKKRLTSKGFSTKGFTKIDIRELHQLPTGSKKVDILSTHPTNSYEMSVRSDGTKVIVIKDPTEFWRHSRFLVVKTK
jgi:predicted  nucleic acid-binding Zn-ribbon protein